MTLENNVYEVGLERLVDEGKPADYIGRDALQADQGPKAYARKLAGVEIAGDPIPFNMAKWPVRTARPDPSGTSPRPSSRRGSRRTSATRWCPVSLARPGTTLTVAVPEVGDRAATVVPMPFIDPKKAIPKA